VLENSGFAEENGVLILLRQILILLRRALILLRPALLLLWPAWKLLCAGSANLVFHVKQLAGPAAKLPLARQDLRPASTTLRRQTWPP